MVKETKLSTPLTIIKNTVISISAVLIAIVSIYSICSTTYRHFAKTEEVEEVKEEQKLIEDRLELKIIDDEIRRELNSKHELESYKIFQQVEEPKFSEPEKRILKEKEDKIEELKQIRRKKYTEIEEKVKSKK